MQLSGELVGLAGGYAAGGDGIDADIIRRPIGGKVAGEADERGLHDRVSDRFHRLLIFGHAFFPVEALVRGNYSKIRRHVEDNARVSLDHLLSEDARTEEGAGEADGDVGVPCFEGEVFEARPRLTGVLIFYLGV